MGKKSKARRERRKRAKVFVKPDGDKLDRNSKTKAGRIALEDADQADTDFYPITDWFGDGDSEVAVPYQGPVLWF